MEAAGKGEPAGERPGEGPEDLWGRASVAALCALGAAGSEGLRKDLNREVRAW